MALTKIEWCDVVWNPITGCTPVSEGCENCYAKRMAKRLAGRCGYPEDEPFRVTFHEDKLQEPLKWKKSQKVFVCSMGDLFHEDVPLEYIRAVFKVIASARRHTFLILTKRVFPMSLFIRRYGNEVGWPLSNVWLGVTVENQKMADKRTPILLQIPAKVRFVSVEPMLGPVDLTKLSLGPNGYGLDFELNALTGWATGYNVETGEQRIARNDEFGRIDWVICGGETGPNARPMHPDWVRSLRDQCKKAEVPFFFKSWGDYKPLPYSDRGDGLHALTEYKGCKYDFVKVGKKAAGRLLDGQIWDEMPIVERRQ